MVGVIDVGTDFSGMEMPVIALRKLNVRHRHVFSSDNNKACRKLIKHVFKPKRLYKDVVVRNVHTTPGCDLYTSGFPCQAYSSLGKGLGVNDKRGCLVKYSIQYIRVHKPRCVLMENVKGLAFRRHRTVLKRIVHHLTNFGNA